MTASCVRRGVGVRWTCSGLHPKLSGHQTFALREPTRLRRVTRERSRRHQYAGVGYLYHHSLDAGRSRPRNSSGGARGGRRACTSTTRSIIPQLLAEQANSSLDLVTLHMGRLSHGVGVGRRGDTAGRTAPDRPLPRPAVLNDVRRPSSTNSTAKLAGWQVVSVSVRVPVLCTKVAPSPASSVSITFAGRAKTPHQHLAGTHKAIVVINRSTGEIWRSRRAPGPCGRSDRDHRSISTGVDIQDDHRRYGRQLPLNRCWVAPGRSTSGVPFPTTVTIWAVVPCHARFLQHHLRRALSSRPLTGLTQATRQSDRRPGVDGFITTVTSSYPPTVDLAEVPGAVSAGSSWPARFGMAAVAATASAGKDPVLAIAGWPTAVEGVPPISQKVDRRAAAMMRLVVTNGTAKGDHWLWRVFGKTGEALPEARIAFWFARYPWRSGILSLIVEAASSVRSTG